MKLIKFELIEQICFSCSMLMLIILGFFILYGEKAYMDRTRLHSHEKMLIQANHEIEKENKALEIKIERLQKDIRYIEHLARHELGMVAQNELIFRFRENE